MLTGRIFLGKEGAPPYLDLYIPDHILLGRTEVRPLVLVIPGGGYRHCVAKEGEPVALAFAGKGINAAVLTYRTGEGVHYPDHLIDGAKAMDCLKRHAKKWGSDSRFVYVIGFSAGGHLAASLATLWNKEETIASYDCRPRAQILCYAVTLSGRYENKITYDMLAGDDEAIRSWNKLDDQVESLTPPAFIWHTEEDQIVPVENALLYAVALRKEHVPFELHIYEHGPHALALCEEFDVEDSADADERIAGWFPLMLSWLGKDMCRVQSV